MLVFRTCNIQGCISRYCRTLSWVLPTCLTKTSILDHGQEARIELYISWHGLGKSTVVMVIFLRICTWQLWWTLNHSVTLNNHIAVAIATLYKVCTVLSDVSVRVSTCSVSCTGSWPVRLPCFEVRLSVVNLLIQLNCNVIHNFITVDNFTVSIVHTKVRLVIWNSSKTTQPARRPRAGENNELPHRTGQYNIAKWLILKTVVWTATVCDTMPKK